MIEGEVDEAILFVHGVTSERLAEEDVPVGLVLQVHVLLHSTGYLWDKKRES